MSRTYKFIGVDPGDRWTGVAMLEVRKGEKRIQLRLSSFVVDGQGDIYRAVPFINSLMEGSYLCEMAIEVFRHRPVGHQSWKVPVAAKLIGALELSAREYDVPIEFFRPGSAREHLEALKVRTLLAEWASSWPRGEWNHAWSGWRVLTMNLLRNHLAHWLLALMELNDGTVLDPPQVPERIVASPRYRGWVSSSHESTAYDIDPGDRGRIERAIQGLSR